MNALNLIFALGGEKGATAEEDPRAVGWTGQTAPPNSPAGGGGPGSFRHRGPLADSPPNPLEEQHAPVALQSAPQQKKPPNPPPATNPRSLGSKKSVQSTHVDLDIDARIVADGSTTNANVAAKTSFSWPAFSIPAYAFDGAGKITSFNGKFTWKGTITIQTVYGPNASATELSGYGRGTTATDVQNRDITLGFHENCHQADYENYLSNNILPDPPNMNIGMDKDDFEAEKTRFTNEYNQYNTLMRQDSESDTDEVGYTKSKYVQTGKPYQHN